MSENKDPPTDPSQVSESDQGDSESGFLQSSKLRDKLEKLSKWRIDPSLIEFPEDTPEFRGGYATVSRGLLGSQPSIEEPLHEAQSTTGDHPNSDASDPQPKSDTQEPENGRSGRVDGADGQPADGDDDLTTQEGRNENNDDEEQKSHSQMLVPKTGDESASSEQAADEAVGSRDRKPHLKTIVAVKKLKIEKETDLQRVLGLALRESEFLFKLSHPNVVKIQGFVEDLSAHKVWLIFPWEENGNLRDFLPSGEWEIPERISLINDVTLGLDYLHRQQPPIYHGDLKSLNILVTSECHALITDFGSARYLRNDHLRKRSKQNEDQPRSAPDPTTSEEHITLQAIFSATLNTLTLTGSSYTIRWAAPELLQDEGPCLRSDVWSLGWVAYEVMTNTIPFHDIKKDSIVINRVIQGQLPPVTEDARMSLIRALCSLMAQCWSINPEKRPTAEESQLTLLMYPLQPMIVPASTQAQDEEASRLRYAQLLNKLGNMYHRQADHLSALRSYNEALNIYTTENNRKGRAVTLSHLANVHLFRREYIEAVTLYSEALHFHTDAGDEGERASVLCGLAHTYRLQSNYDKAVSLYSEALQVYTKAGQNRAKASTLWGLAEIHRLRAEYNEAIDLLSKALPIFTDVGDHRERACTLCCLADVNRVRHEYDEAIKLYSEATRILTDLGEKHWRAHALLGIAQSHRAQGHHSEAISFYTKASEVLAETGDSKRAADALQNVADIRKTIKGALEGPTGTVDVEKEPSLTSQ
ncbi:hypothetical protein FRC01_005510 [Tulasnella sp. 417]|nr:hypothetical protein FRC01_005510 [Tulasnella sp. 417]